MILPPFEMALRAGARSVMNSYTDIDGVPVAADPTLLTDLLRERLGFTGTVAADYFSVAFLQTLHRVADDLGGGGRAGAGGRDRRRAAVGRTPSARRCSTALAAGRSTRRSSTGRCRGCCGRSASSACSTRTGRRLGAGRRASTSTTPSRGRSRSSSPGGRSCCSPTTAPSRWRPGARVARGRAARRHLRGDARLLLLPDARAGAPPRRRGRAWRSAPSGEALADTFDVSYAPGLPGARRRRRGHRGSGRGRRRTPRCASSCSATRPGSSARAPRGRAATSPTSTCPAGRRSCSRRCSRPARRSCAVLLVGRPYDLSRQVDRLAGLVCGFFPGEEGAQAIADVLSRPGQPVGAAPGQLPGRRLDPALDVPRVAAGAAQRGQRGGPDAAVRVRARTVLRRRHLGRGDHAVGPDSGRPTAPASSWCSSRTRPTGTCRRWCRSTCTTGRPRWCARCSSSSGRPVSTSAPGERATVCFALPADLTSFTGRDLVRIVEPGEVELLGRCLERRTSARC